MAITTVLTTNRNHVAAGAELLGDDAIRISPLPLHGPIELPPGTVWAFVDWLLPTMSGLEMCRRLRAGSVEPARIVMVLEHDDMDDRRRALKAGADDYVVGPIEPRDMIDRVRAYRSTPLAGRGDAQKRLMDDIVRVGHFTIDRQARLARFRGEVFNLRPRQFRLLEHFLANANIVQTRADLIEAVGQNVSEVADRTVDKWIARLRSALEEVRAGQLLRTVHFEGYVLDVALADKADGDAA